MKRSIMRATAGLCLCAGAVAMSPAIAAPAAKATAESNWDLGDLYPSPDAWEAEYGKIKGDVDKLDSFKGKLGDGASEMLTALAAISDVRKALLRLAVYASLKSDEDVRIAANLERKQKSETLATTLGEKTAWVTPEIITIGKKRVMRFRAKSKDLEKRFGFFLDNVLRAEPHTLSEESEGVLAAAGNVLAQPDNTYTQLANGELPFPTITLSDGKKVTLNQQAYTLHRQSANRADRKKVFDSFWHAFKGFEGTLGQTLTTQVMAEVFDAKVRHFPNSLSAAIFSDNMPEGVYRQLVAQANANLPALYRYFKLRKRLLGIKGELGYYDIYPPMINLPSPKKFDVPESERLTLIVTAPYGEEYAALMKKGFAGTWMDVHPRPGKKSGAYMNGSAYDVHPYVLLNHQNDYDALSTFAHEWGHAIHTMLSAKSQNFENADYSTFIAETASIGNELLLNDYMVEHAKTKSEKLFYLGEGLEMIRGTFFRQTMFAEFQLAIHEELEQGRPLSGARMTELYCGLLKKYHGESEGVMKIDPAYCVEWAFIPHFYYGFYVYQYATSLAGAALLTKAIETEGAPARDRFIDMLKAGGSNYPYELYKKAGIDMASPAPYEALVARMTKIMDEIDALEAKK